METMEKCWDDDSDARLTSHCVEQQLKQLVYSSTDEFDSQLLNQLKEPREKEDSTDSSVSSHSALIVGRWDDNSSTKKASSVSSTKSLASSQTGSQYSKSWRSGSSLSQPSVDEITSV